MIKCEGQKLIVEGTTEQIFKELCVIIVELIEEFDIIKITKAIKNNKIGFKKRSGISIVGEKIDIYQD